MQADAHGPLEDVAAALASSLAGARPAGGEMQPEAQRRSSIESGEIARLAAQYTMPTNVVREHWDEFIAMGSNEDGTLPVTEFEAIVSQRCQLHPDQDVPWYLVRGVIGKGEGGGARDDVCFEGYLKWLQSTAYREELMVPDPSERSVREVARQNGLSMLEMDELKSTFVRLDTDRNGTLDKEEFRRGLQTITHSTVSDRMLAGYWREVHPEQATQVTFAEFVIWFSKYMPYH